MQPSWEARGRKQYTKRKRQPLRGEQNDDYKFERSPSVPKLRSHYTCEGEDTQFTWNTKLLRMNSSFINVRMTRPKQSCIGNVQCSAVKILEHSAAATFFATGKRWVIVVKPNAVIMRRKVSHSHHRCISLVSPALILHEKCRWPCTPSSVFQLLRIFTHRCLQTALI